MDTLMSGWDPWSYLNERIRQCQFPPLLIRSAACARAPEPTTSPGALQAQDHIHACMRPLGRPRGWTRVPRAA